LLQISFQHEVRGQVFDFKLYTTREGLLSDGVTTLFQDSYGYLWIGTTDGISVYDGHSFRNYTIVDGLASSWINCIIEDREDKGVMWIATLGGGISRFYNGIFSNYKIGNDDWSNRVNSISQAGDGTIYCATDKGIYSINGQTSSPVLPRTFKGTFNQIAWIKDSLLVLDEQGDLMSYNPAIGSVHRLTGKWISKFKVSTFALGPEGHLWIGLADGSIIDFYNQRIAVRAMGLPASFIFDSGLDALWAGGADGLYRFDKETFGKSTPVHLTTVNGLLVNYVWSGLCDSEGDLWFGNEGVCKLEDEHTCSFDAIVPNISIDNSQAVADKNGHIWAISKNGLFEIWRGQSGLIQCHVHSFEELGLRRPEYSIRIQNDSILWLCSEDGTFHSFGIEHISHEQSRLKLVRNYSTGRAFRAGEFLCFFVDRDSRIWCSLNKFGLVTIDTKQHIKNNLIRIIRGCLPDNSIRAMYQDSCGNLWFGGYIGGLAEFCRAFERDSSTHLYTTKDGLPDNSIRAIAQDSLGRLWIGTRFGGLSIMNAGRFENISEKNGLVSNSVWAISNERNKDMLLGTQLGLQRLSRGIDSAREFRSLSGRVPVYSLGTSSSNLLWMCTPAGITVSDLSARPHPTPPPPVHITELLVNGGRVPFTQPFKLSHLKNTLTIYFAGTSLREENKLSYRYILKGVDNSWRYSPMAHPVTYASLKPGSYTFEVQAIEPSGLESAQPASISFVIIPPYWQQWWFILAIAVVAFLSVRAAIKFRLSKLLEIEHVRSKIATDLHDDIGSGLTRIAVLSEVAARQTARNGNGTNPDDYYSAHSLVERIGANARELVDSMSDVVWSVDPKNMTVGDLLKRLNSFATEISEAKGIAVDFNVEERVQSIRVDPQILRAILLIAKEALSNSVKYSNCRSVHIGMKVSNRAIELRLADDGCGFDVANRKTGHGLENMRIRSEKIGGSLAIKSSRGEGTFIEAVIPFIG